MTNKTTAREREALTRARLNGGRPKTAATAPSPTQAPPAKAPTNPPPPAPAAPVPPSLTREEQEARRVRRAEAAAALRARGAARDALNQALDRIGERRPTDAEAADLVRLAAPAFDHGSAADKLTKALWRWAAAKGQA